MSGDELLGGYRAGIVEQRSQVARSRAKCVHLVQAALVDAVVQWRRARWQGMPKAYALAVADRRDDEDRAQHVFELGMALVDGIVDEALGSAPDGTATHVQPTGLAV